MKGIHATPEYTGKRDLEVAHVTVGRCLMNKVLVIFAAVLLLGSFALHSEARPRRWPAVPFEAYQSACQIAVDGKVVGSGFCAAKDRIMTAAHILIGSEIVVQYRLDAERWSYHPAEILAVDVVHDVAVLGVLFCRLKVAPLADRTPEWGEQVAVVGCAQRHEPMPYLGAWGEYVPPWVESFRPGLRTITAPNCVGNSGAPVWDLNAGGICAMTSCKDSKFDHLTYVVPVRYLRALLDGLSGGA